ncbi:MAG: c-type cytochrome [Perlucidibaca sp.]
MKVMLLLSALAASLMSTAQAASIEQRYEQTCKNCHEVGVMQAPKRGDKAAWAARLKQGDAVLLTHVKNGFKMMPPKGLCNDCTDAEYKALIKYMSK